MATKNRRTDDVKIEKRRHQVAILLSTMARPSVRRIQDALANLSEPIAVGKSTVDRDIRAIRDEWKVDRLADMDIVIGGELEKLKMIEERTWHALQRSMLPTDDVQTKTRRVPVRNAEGELEVRDVVDTIVTHREGRLDPRLVRSLVEVQDRRAKLLGLDAPKGLDLTSGGKTLSFTVDIGAEDWQPPKLTGGQKKLVKGLKKELNGEG